MFVKPIKRSSRFKKFSKHETLVTSADGRFALQKRKKFSSPTAQRGQDSDDDDEASVVYGDGQHDLKRHYGFRIIILGNPYYEVAFSDDLAAFRDREWRYIDQDLPKKLPEYKNEDLLPWMLAHFTCLAMELKETRQTPADDVPSSPTVAYANATPNNPANTGNTANISTTATRITADQPYLQPHLHSQASAAEEHARYQAQLAAQQNYVQPIRSTNTDGLLIPSTTYPLFGFLPFVIISLMVNIPLILLRDFSDNMFLGFIVVINAVIFVRVLLGFPSILGLSTLLPYNKIYNINSPTPARVTTGPAAAMNCAVPANALGPISEDGSQAEAAVEQQPEVPQTAANLQPGGATTVTPTGFSPALSLKCAAPGVAQPNTFSDCMGQSWQLRTGPNYAVNKKKDYSTGALFDLLGMDVFQSKTKVQHIARYVDFEPLYTMKAAPYIDLGTEFDYTCKDVQEKHEKNPLPHVQALRQATEQENATGSFDPRSVTLENCPKYDFKPDPTGKVQPLGDFRDGFHFGTVDRPFIWIITMQIPTYEPSYYSPASDGEGMNLVWYLRATPETQRDLLRPEPISPAVRCLKKYVLANPTDPDFQKNMDRFKNIPRLVNTSDFDFGYLVNKLVSQYNAKPFLTRPQGVLNRGPGYACFDLDIHRFCHTAKKVLYSFLDKMDRVILDWCFCVEGYDDDELPEVSLGQIRLVKISYQSFPSWEATYEELKKVQTVGFGQNDATPKITPGATTAHLKQQ